MNFYTLTFKTTKNPKAWLKGIFIISFSISLFIFAVNYIVDPYHITQYNLLNIKYKFARDDRTEKLNYFKTLPSFDTILIGSSRVYSINPKIVSDILGGETYNFGVGTATVEDHLGVIKYLEKNKKLPKNIIIGIDFYTFNPDVPPNGYFLKNRELNFLSYQNYSEDYLAKFFSIDSFRASFKTLQKHFSSKEEKPRFNANGWGGSYSSSSNNKNMPQEIQKELEENQELFYSNFTYNHIDPKRQAYYEEIKEICQKYHITLYLFTTPLHPYLLKELEQHKSTSKALKEFITFLSTFNNFRNFYQDEIFYNNVKYFHGITHTTPYAGDIIIRKLLTESR